MEKKIIRWTISKARQQFNKLIQMSSTNPQPIFNRDQLVAAVVDPESFKAFCEWRAQQKIRSLEDAFSDLREILREDEEPFATPERQNRKNLFAESLDELSR